MYLQRLKFAESCCHICDKASRLRMTFANGSRRPLLRKQEFIETTWQWGEDNSVSRESDWKARYNTDAGSSPRCGKRFTSQSQFLVQTLLQSISSTSVRTLKISNTDSHDYHCLDTRKYCVHWQKWVALLLRLLCLTQVRWPEFPAKDNEV